MSNDSSATAPTLTKPVVVRKPLFRGGDRPDWNVEQFDDYGDCWRAIFIGPDSEVRTRQYAQAIEAGRGPSHHHNSPTAKLTTPVVIRNVVSGWSVEQRDEDGECWKAIFFGHQSEARARQYATWIATLSGPGRHPAAALGIIAFAVQDDAPSLPDEPLVDPVSDQWTYVLELDLGEKSLFDDVLASCEDWYRQALARNEAPPFAATPDDIERIRNQFRCIYSSGARPQDLDPTWSFTFREFWELELEEDLMMALDDMLLHFRAHHPSSSAQPTNRPQQPYLDRSIEGVQKRKRWARPPTS